MLRPMARGNRPLSPAARARLRRLAGNPQDHRRCAAG